MERTLEMDDRSDWLKAAGGVLIAVGALILFARKADPWDDFPLLLVIGLPFLLLYGLGAIGNPVGPADRDRARRNPVGDRAQGADRDRVGDHGHVGDSGVTRWRAVLLVAGVLLSLIFFPQLMETIGIDTDKNIVGSLIFALVAGVAAYAAFGLGAAYQAFLAALAGIGAWLLLWFAILDDPSLDTVRWLLLILAAGYFVLGVVLHGARARQGPEIITAAGVVAISAGLVGLLSAAAATVGGLSGATPEDAGGQGLFWDLFLLTVSLALVIYGAWSYTRGPAYVGAIGLLAFVIIQGAEVNAILDGESPDQSFAGWPLVLLLLGAAALAAGLFMRDTPGTGTRVPAEPAPVAPTTSATAAPPRDEF